MKKHLSIIALTASLSFSAQAAEILLTPSSAKSKESRGSNSVALDFVSDGDVVGFQLNIPLPKGADASQINIESCVSDVSKKYFSQCNIAKGHIVVQVVNDDSTPIPAGVFPVGKIMLKGISASDLGKIDVITADKNAESIQSSARIVK